METEIKQQQQKQREIDKNFIEEQKKEREKIVKQQEIIKK